MRTSRRTACVALSCVCLLARTQALVLPAAGGTPRRFARHATSRPIMAESSSQPATVDITQLLGCCVCACERAAAVIRAVESKRRSATTGAIEGAVLKDASDSRSYLTEADTAAQKVIMQTLRGAFPAVTIIGEEDEEEADTTEAPAAPGLSATAARVASEFEGAPASLRAVPAGDVCVFVDPVDGTKEFVEGRLGAVQTLIGVSVQGNAVAGAVGIPFMPPYARVRARSNLSYSAWLCHRHIFRLSNDQEHGIPGVGPQWHNDGSFERAVFSHVGYHIIRVPENGGATKFCHQGAAFDALSPEEQEIWQRRASINSNSGVVHPLVHEHPISGRKSVYLHLGMTGAVVEMKPGVEQVEKMEDLRLLQQEEMTQLFNRYNELLKDSCPTKQGLRILHRTTVKGMIDFDPPPKFGLPPTINVYGRNPFGSGVFIGGGLGFRWDPSIRMQN
eukprot:Tamp_10671.p2 GENE.Tamp_10671~~Tamp_10671.p2  ORF type:complete len:448 (+),score=90.14 Tamp_10671:97-1440(+)